MQLPYADLLKLKDDASAAQTAMATWWLFWATAAAAAGTIAAVVVALWSSTAEGRRRRDNLRARDVAAFMSVLNGREYMRAICERRNQAAPDMQVRALWTILGILSAHRKVAEHYLMYPLNSPDLPGLLADTLQRNYEVRDAISGLLPENHGPVWVTEANYTLSSASDRMDGNEDQVTSLKKKLKIK